MGVRRMLIQTVGNWCSAVEDCHTIELTDKRGNCEQGKNYRAEVLKSEVCGCIHTRFHAPERRYES